MYFYIKTFGCQMNKADSEVISSVLTAAGHIPVDSASQAELIIINTCNVRDHAVNRLYGHIRSLKPTNSRSTKPYIAVGGCVAEINKSNIFKTLPQVDIIFGTRTFNLLPEALSELAGGISHLSFIDRAQSLPDDLQGAPVDPVRAWLPISRGCDNYCTYCVVPYARGREHSTPYNTAVKQAEDHVRRGVKEITLLGQNVNSYGIDLKEKDLFARLLRRLDTIDGLRRVRFMTSHPKDLSPATIAAVASCNSVCEYIHLPLQSGSNRILNLMNRRYTVDEYHDLVYRIRQSVHGVSLSTDIIVGFPGETEEEFTATLTAIEEIRFDSAYTFIYSARPGTAAAELEDRTSFAEKQDRLKQLIAIQSKISRENNLRYVGTQVELFVERPSRYGGRQMAGRTRTNKIVNFAAGTDLIDTFVNVTIDDATPVSLKGRICGKIV